MSPLDIFNHLINLVAPALVLGLLVAAALVWRYFLEEKA